MCLRLVLRPVDHDLLAWSTMLLNVPTSGLVACLRYNWTTLRTFIVLVKTLESSLCELRWQQWLSEFAVLNFFIWVNHWSRYRCCNHLWLRLLLLKSRPSQGAIDAQEPCLHQLIQVLSVFFCLECHLDPILQRYFVDDDLQQYLYRPEPTAVIIILCCCHINCLKLKGLCSLNRSIIHDNFSTLGIIKGTIVLEQIWKMWSDE